MLNGLGRLAFVGAGGVDIFFCISGVAIAHSFGNLVLGTALKRSWFQHINPDVLIVASTLVLVLLTASTYRLIEIRLMRWVRALVFGPKAATEHA